MEFQKIQEKLEKTSRLLLISIAVNVVIRGAILVLVNKGIAVSKILILLGILA